MNQLPLLLGISLGVGLMLPVVWWQERVKAHWRHQAMIWLIRSIDSELNALVRRSMRPKQEPETDPADWWKK